MRGEFLSGPIRMEWLHAAARLPGATLAVALQIRHLHKMRGPEWVVLSNGTVEGFGVSPSAKARALKELVKAGLVEMQPPLPGCAPRVLPIGDK